MVGRPMTSQQSRLQSARPNWFSKRFVGQHKLNKSAAVELVFLSTSLNLGQKITIQSNLVGQDESFGLTFMSMGHMHAPARPFLSHINQLCTRLQVHRSLSTAQLKTLLGILAPSIPLQGLFYSLPMWDSF